jgi:hypothetical protein
VIPEQVNKEESYSASNILQRERGKGMEERRRARKLSLALSTIALFLLILGSATIFVFYTDIQRIGVREADEIDRMKESEWKFIESVIGMNRRAADRQGGEISSRIRERLLEEYEGNMEQLAEDIWEPTNDSRFSGIVNEEITGKYLNVENDNNDPIVATSRGVVADRSVNAAVDEDRFRDWESEAKRQFNPYLAMNAIDKIRNMDTDGLVFWEYLRSDSRGHEMVTDMSMESLKRVFMNEGVEGLSTYEILTVSYIDQDRDIFSVPDVNNVGRRNENRKIMVIQGFSITDALEKGYSSDLKFYQEREREISRDAMHEEELKKIVIVMMSFILILTFMGLAFVQNRNIVTHEDRRKQSTNK